MLKLQIFVDYPTGCVIQIQEYNQLARRDIKNAVRVAIKGTSLLFSIIV